MSSFFCHEYTFKFQQLEIFQAFTQIVLCTSTRIATLQSPTHFTRHSLIYSSFR